MNIHEHQAKEILKEFGAPVDAGAGVGMTKVNTAESTKASITETGKGARISQLI